MSCGYSQVRALQKYSLILAANHSMLSSFNVSGLRGRSRDPALNLIYKRRHSYLSQLPEKGRVAISICKE